MSRNIFPTYFCGFALILQGLLAEIVMLGIQLTIINTREYHGGRFGGVLEAVLPSVSVVETFPKWTESGFNREHSFVKMFSMEF